MYRGVSFFVLKSFLVAPGILGFWKPHSNLCPSLHMAFCCDVRHVSIYALANFLKITSLLTHSSKQKMRWIQLKLKFPFWVHISKFWIEHSSRAIFTQCPLLLRTSVIWWRAHPISAMIWYLDISLMSIVVSQWNFMCMYGNFFFFYSYVHTIFGSFIWKLEYHTFPCVVKYSFDLF
jgi:hypothetical protein